ncbi:LapA family protein [Arthrobacter sp. B6]|uniref:LapA family protein n=1 Tax=Arthrobacter sp. B6 TaxID=1570137 RepID=UPI0009EE61B2|nr:lipopolysaccharide assembly protein LapA domain-containing protein [Arthrobacter sp. B6]
MQTNPSTPKTSIPPPPARPPVIGDDPSRARYSGEPAPPTRAALVWAATVAGLVVLSLLIVFILQNQEPVHVQYLGLGGSVPLGIALSIAAVAGGFLVAIVGAVRIAQLRIIDARLRHRSPRRQPAKARLPLLSHRHHAR